MKKATVSRVAFLFVLLSRGMGAGWPDVRSPERADDCVDDVADQNADEQRHGEAVAVTGQPVLVVGRATRRSHVGH